MTQQSLHSNQMADLMEWTDVTEDTAQVTKNANSGDWARSTGPENLFVRLLVTSN